MWDKCKVNKTSLFIIAFYLGLMEQTNRIFDVLISCFY